MSEKTIASMQNFTVALSLVVVVGLSGFGISCSGGGDSDVSSNSSASASPVTGVPATSASPTADNPRAGSITATPNPVPAGQGNGSTTIRWKTNGNLIPVEVYVVQDAQPEVKFAEGVEGTAEAPWIVAGSKYEFRLYAGSARKLISNVQVTRTQ
jgi:hypothetical protein